MRLATAQRLPNWTPADAAALAAIKVGDIVWRTTLARFPLRPECLGMTRPEVVTAVTPHSVATADSSGASGIFANPATWDIATGRKVTGAYNGRIYASRPAHFREPLSDAFLASLAVAANVEQVAA